MPKPTRTTAPAETPEPTPSRMDPARWPALNVELLPVAGLSPFPLNPRLHSEDNVDAVADSIRTWGWTLPVLADPAMTIIAGHCRVLAAKKLGLERIPVAVAEGWTRDEVAAYCVADNQLTLGSSWDTGLLSANVRELDGKGFDLSLLGFPADDLESLLHPPVKAPPDEFPAYGEDIETEYECPSCGYSWSGKRK